MDFCRPQLKRLHLDRPFQLKRLNLDRPWPSYCWTLLPLW